MRDRDRDREREREREICEDPADLIGKIRMDINAWQAFFCTRIMPSTVLWVTNFHNMDTSDTCCNVTASGLLFSKPAAWSQFWPKQFWLDKFSARYHTYSVLIFFSLPDLNCTECSFLVSTTTCLSGILFVHLHWWSFHLVNFLQSKHSFSNHFTILPETETEKWTITLKFCMLQLHWVLWVKVCTSQRSLSNGRIWPWYKSFGNSINNKTARDGSHDFCMLRNFALVQT